MRTYRIFPDTETTKKAWKNNKSLQAEFRTIKEAKQTIADFDDNPYSDYKDRKKWGLTFHITAYENHYDFVKIVAHNL